MQRRTHPQRRSVHLLAVVAAGVLAACQPSVSATGPAAAPSPSRTSGSLPTAGSTPPPATGSRSVDTATPGAVSSGQVAPAPAETADGYAAGTTGGAAGATVTVSTAAELTRYAGATDPYVIRIASTISLSGQIKVTSNKTIIGTSGNAGLTGGGLNIRGAGNVIVRNLTISKAVGTDAISVYGSQHVWITQNDLSSDLAHGKDYYDGLLDITKASDFVTVSWNRFHDHYKVMLIGASDDDTTDKGRLHVTVHHNYFRDVNSRLPSLRFGTGHVYDNVFQNADTAVNSRMGATVLLQANVFRAVGTPVITTGYGPQDGTVVLATDHPNDFGGATPAGTTASSSTVSLPYSSTVEPAATVATSVPAGAGPR